MPACYVFDDKKLMKKSWREKLANDKGLPKVETIPAKMLKKWGRGTMLIPAPKEVDAVMRQVRKSRLTTINDIRRALARKHRATLACPITTGIFAWIAAGAAAEDEAEGKKRITPYWRTLKNGGELNAKYPGGLAKQKQKLLAEGHQVTTKGKRMFVVEYEKRLASFK